MYGYELDLAKDRINHFVDEAERVQAASQLLLARKALRDAARGRRIPVGVLQFPAAVVHALIG
jgi:hypothetical protein